MAKPSKADIALLRTARARFKQATDADQKQRDREKVDLGFYAGDQWPTDILLARQGLTMNQNLPPVPARPTVTINLVKEPVRQVLNQERQSDLGIELIPADDFGTLAQPINDEEIQLREGIIRRIQRDSEAADARSWAFSRAVIAGRGYYGVMTRYAKGKTADQEIYLERFYDQNGVRLDPSHEQPDGSDANWGFTGTDSMPWDEYTVLHPELADGSKNPMVDWSATDFGLLEPEEKSWFTFDPDGNPTHVRCVNYYFATWTGKELAMFPDGRAEWVKALPPETPEDSYTRRTVAERQIEWVKTDGVHVLDRTDWPGHYIPIVKVVGEELQPYDKERRCEGIVRPAIEPGRSANYMISKFVETVGLSPIPQWIMAAGQDEGFENEWDNINTRTLGRLHYNVKDLEGNAAGPPQRVSTQSDVAAVAGGVQLFMEFVQKVMSSPDPALGHVDPTIKSGKLGKLLMDRALMGNSNYMDNLTRSMRHEARVINDLLYPIYGQRKGRLMRLLNGNKESQSVLIGQPMIEQDGRPMPAPDGHPETKVYTLTPDVEFTVTCKVSKNYDTRRQEVADMLTSLIGADPALMQVFGDLLLEMQDAPMAKELSERMKVMLAPPVQEMLKKGQAAPIPPEVQAQMAQMQQQLAELQPLADANRARLMEVQLKSQTDAAKASADNETKVQLAQMQVASDERGRALDNLVKLAVAELSSQTQGAKTEAEMARTALGFDHTHAEGERDRAHEQAQHTLDLAHAAIEADKDRQMPSLMAPDA